MAINSGSRYESSIVDYFRKEEGGITYPIVRYEFDNLSEASFFYHTYQTGETFHALSQIYFHTPSLWWTIAEYNPEITDVTRVSNGTLIRIPSA